MMQQSVGSNLPKTKDDAKLELRYQNVLQVVELDKAIGIVPNQRKTKERFNK